MDPQVSTSYPVSFETGKHYKVHGSYIWLAPIVVTLAIVLVGGLNSVQGIIGAVAALQQHGVLPKAILTILLVIIGIAVVYGIICAICALAYKNMSYVFDEREFSFYSGIIIKKRVHLPYSRVQSVNHRAGIVQRLAGVCTVTIDSAGGASNKALRIPYLRLGTAERLRNDIFVRKAAVAVGAESSVVYVPDGTPTTPVDGARKESNVLDAAAGAVAEFRGVFGGDVAGLETPTYQFGLSNKELALASFTHGASIITGIYVAMAGTATLAPVLTAKLASPYVSLLFIPLIIGIILVAWLIGAAINAIAYGKYSCCRRGSRIEVESGLLQRRFSGIDISRIQSIEIRQTVIRQLLGYCEIAVGRISAAGDEGGKKGNSIGRALVIHPFVKLEYAEQIIAGLIPEMDDRPRVQEISKLPKTAFRRSLIRRCLCFNVGVYVAGATLLLWSVLKNSPGTVVYPDFDTAVTFFIVILLFCAVYTVARGAGALLWVRNSGYTWNRDYLLLHNAGWWENTAIIPRQKLQAGYTMDNPFQRRLSLTTLYAMTAAGVSKTSAKLIDIPAENGKAYLDWLKPRRTKNVG